MKRGYWPNVAMYAPIAIAMIVGAYIYSNSVEDFIKHFIIYWLGGCGLMWTYTEYYFHRHALHGEVHLDPTAEADGEHNALMFSQHLHHHVFMNQYYRIALMSGTYWQFAGYTVVGTYLF